MGTQESKAMSDKDASINPSSAPELAFLSEEVIPVCESFRFTDEELKEVRTTFLNEMENGLKLAHGKGATADQSSLKMISSHINVLPSGDEKGVFFAVDLGGTNLRVLRVCLQDGQTSIREFREAIPASVMSKKSTATDLFDFIAQACAQLHTTDLSTEQSDSPIPLGFTFSFPCLQTSVKSGQLLEWTKGFETRDCVGQDPAVLLQKALDRLQLPLIVDALCNDTVGTLMTNRYSKKSEYCRIGVILGTGTNAAYSDPTLEDLIINIEWGGFDKFPKRASLDAVVDSNSANPGKQFLEKMVSGLYLGELVRLGTIYEIQRLNQITRNASTQNNFLVIPPALLEPHSIDAAMVSIILESHDKEDTSELLSSNSVLFSLKGNFEVWSIMREISECVLERSAAVAAAVLSAVIQKATAGRPSSQCEVGIDGSLFKKGHRYKQRLMDQLGKYLNVDNVSLDYNEDGSGLGAALVAAAIAKGRSVEVVHDRSSG